MTERIAVCATIHAPLAHPMMAAKQAATIDHISGGRFVLNLVCGWFRDEFEMFAAEWLALARKAWTETEPYAFNGEFFTGKAIWSEPKPLQDGALQIMNAGSSPAGQRLSAENCDMNLVMLRQKDEASDRSQMAKLKTMAVNAGRKSHCWIHG